MRKWDKTEKGKKWHREYHKEWQEDNKDKIKKYRIKDKNRQKLALERARDIIKD